MRSVGRVETSEERDGTGAMLLVEERCGGGSGGGCWRSIEPVDESAGTLGYVLDELDVEALLGAALDGRDERLLEEGQLEPLAHIVAQQVGIGGCCLRLELAVAASRCRLILKSGRVDDEHRVGDQRCATGGRWRLERSIDAVDEQVERLGVEADRHALQALERRATATTTAIKRRLRMVAR